MTWNAFSHSYIGRRPNLTLTPAHAFEHLLHMRNRSLRHNAVAEIEDKRAARECFEDLINRAVKRRATGDKHERIEIALHRNARLDLITCKRGINCPIETNSIDRHVRDVAQQPRTC